MSDEVITQRAGHIQRLLNSYGWTFAKETLTRVVKTFEDDALNCDDPSQEARLLHHAQAARLVLRKFENALAIESSATEADQENNG